MSNPIHSCVLYVDIFTCFSISCATVVLVTNYVRVFYIITKRTYYFDEPSIFSYNKKLTCLLSTILLTIPCTWGLNLPQHSSPPRQWKNQPWIQTVTPPTMVCCCPPLLPLSLNFEGHRGSLCFKINVYTIFSIVLCWWLSN